MKVTHHFAVGNTKPSKPGAVRSNSSHILKQRAKQRHVNILKKRLGFIQNGRLNYAQGLVSYAAFGTSYIYKVVYCTLLCIINRREYPVGTNS